MFTALAILAGVSSRTNYFSGAAADMLEVRSRQIETLNQYKQALLTLNLAAMDAIVDKGAVVPFRLMVLHELSALQDGLTTRHNLWRLA